ncbi:MAG: NnrS family protein [Rhodospirillaceae bacterium]|nr:NnrS family protein [Rhodospirillaceae bacterium]
MSSARVAPYERIVEIKRKAEAGPVILQNSFRLFFLAAGIWATLAVPFWLMNYAGILILPTGFDGLLWHQHEMLFGFAGAAMAGFILTAIPNWTGGLPVSGWRLGFLVTLWLVGRMGFLTAPVIGPIAAAVLDLSFLTALVGVIARELISARNWRNLPVLVLISLFTCGNWLVHFELNGIGETAAFGIRLSTFVLVILVAVIGGRIVPSFTRNWLVRQGAEKLPAPMGRFDILALAALIAFVIAQVLMPHQLLTSYLALLAGALHGLRLARWKGWAVFAEPLLWILHLGYAWLAVALTMIGLAGLTVVVPVTAAIHALTVGAFGTMILAVMTRASLGHTGRTLTATPGTTVIFILITIAAVTRVGAPFLSDQSLSAIWISGIAWTAAYGLFTVLYFPVFTEPRANSRPPDPISKQTRSS